MKRFKLTWEVSTLYTGGKKPSVNIQRHFDFIDARDLKSATNKAMKKLRHGADGHNIKIVEVDMANAPKTESKAWDKAMVGALDQLVEKEGYSKEQAVAAMNKFFRVLANSK